MKLKTGDNVKVLSGKDKNKTGKIIQMLWHKERALWYVVVEGVNVRKKHLKAKSKGQPGQIISLPNPLNASKVMLIDPKSGKPTRVAMKKDGDKKKRVAKKSGEFID